MQIHQQMISAFRESKISNNRTMRVVTHKIVIYGIELLEKINGFKTNKGDSLSQRYLIITGAWESETVSFAKKLIQPGWIVLDIGAHVGFFSVIFSKLVGRLGKVICFEPNPETYAILHENVASKPNILTINSAVGASDGTATLFSRADEVVTSSLSQDYAQTRSRDAKEFRDDVGEIREYKVNITTIDSCLADRQVDKIDLIKIDIEGAELSALKGMSKTIQKQSQLIMIVELSKQSCNNFGHEPIDLLRSLVENGLQVFSLNPPTDLLPITTDERLNQLALSLGEFGYVNLVCFKGYSNDLIESHGYQINEKVFK